jgi:hypothetical protein
MPSATTLMSTQTGEGKSLGHHTDEELKSGKVTKHSLSQAQSF